MRPGGTESESAAVSRIPPAMDLVQHRADNQEDLPRPFKCFLCDRAFHRFEHQSRHLRTHTGEKPHACQFPGCIKRFARSDECIRHSRLHNNPDTKWKSQTRHSIQNSKQFRAFVATTRRPPPTTTIPQSTSAFGISSSPNIAPAYSYVPITTQVGGSFDTHGPTQGMSSAYISASSIPDTQSRVGASCYSLQRTEEPHPGSRPSTASALQIPLPTPDYTSFGTPLQSPLLRPCGGTYNLPEIRCLPLQLPPALAPMEPRHINCQYDPSKPPFTSGHSSGLRIRDIMAQTDGAQRRLPIVETRYGTTNDSARY